MGSKRVTQRGLEVVDVDRRATTCCSCAARSRARGRHRGGAQDALRLRRSAAATSTARRRRLRRAFNGPLVHEAVRAELNARRQGTRATQDPRRGPRRRRQAVAPEGHRPRPRRLIALAASGRAAASRSARSRATTPSRSTARRAAPRCAARCRSTPTRGSLAVFDAARFDEPSTQAGRRSCWPTGARRPPRSCCSTPRRRTRGLVVPQPRARARAAGRGRRRRRRRSAPRSLCLRGRAGAAHGARANGSRDGQEEAA